MADFSFEIPRDATRIWDLLVPIVVDKETDTIKIYLTNAIEEPLNYNEACYMLDTATKNTVVEIYLNTPGGVIDSAFMLADAIKRTKATVKAYLSGTVASAGTLVTMVCDQVEVSPHLSFMIHNYSGGMSGKGHEMKARQKFTDDHLNEAFKSFYSGFLTDEEMGRVIEGTDLWMNSTEVQERWNSRVDYLKGN